MPQASYLDKFGSSAISKYQGKGIAQRVGEKTLSTLGEALSVPQKSATFIAEAIPYVFSGGNTQKPKYESPSVARGLEGTGEGLALDIIADPLNFLTAPLAGASKINLGNKFGKLKGLTATENYFKDLGKIREASLKNLSTSMAEKGYVNLGGNFADVMVKADRLKEAENILKTPFASVERLRETLGDDVIKVFEEAEKMAIKTTEELSDGIVGKFAEETGFTTKSLNTEKWFQKAALEAYIPFTDARRTLISSESLSKGVSAFKNAVNGIPVLSDAIKGVSTGLNKAFDAKTTVSGLKAGDEFTQEVNNQARLAEIYERNLTAPLEELVKRLKKQESLGGEEFLSLEKSIYNNNFNVDDFKNFSEETQLLAKTVKENIDAINAIRKEKEIPVLNGFLTGQYATKETKEYLASKELETAPMGISREFQLKTEGPHRTWMRLEGSEYGAGKIANIEDENLALMNQAVVKRIKDVYGKNLQKLTNEELRRLIKEGAKPESIKALQFAANRKQKVLSEVINTFENALKDEKYTSYINKDILKKIKKGEIEITELDSKLARAYVESPVKINESVGRKMFEESFFENAAQDIATNAKVIASDDFTNRIIDSAYVFTKKSEADKVPEGWVKVTLLNKASKANPKYGYYMEKGNAEYLTRTNDMLFKNETAQALYNGVRRFTAWFKGWTLGIFPSYTFRNGIDDGTRMLASGGTDIKGALYDPYAEFAPMLTKWKNGIPLDKNDFILDLEQKTGLPVETIMRKAQEYGAISSGQTNIEMKDLMTSLSSIKEITKEGKVLQAVGRQNPLVQKGFEFNNMLEDGRRLSLFTQQLKKGKGFPEAAKTTREILFDYSDLTNFEKALRSSALPFYTFLKFSIKFNLQEMMRNPKLYATAYKLGGGIDEEMTYPGEIPFNISWMFPEGKPKYIDLRNYFSMLDTPEKIMPDKIYDTFLGLLSPVIKVPIEITTNYDLYKRRQNYPGEVQEFLGTGWSKNSLPYQMLKSFRPISEVDRMFFKTQLSTGEERSKLTRAMQFFTGLKVNEVDVQARQKLRRKILDRQTSEQETLERNLKKIELKYL